MNGHNLGAAVRRLRESLAGSAGSDAALLDRFTADRDPAAFAALVARYGPLVLGVCRRSVGDPHLAEDLFQAVFLVLARKAGSIRKRDAVGSWLCGVAYRLGRKARTRLRLAAEPRNVNVVDDPAATAAWNDLLAALDQELHRLPDRLRAPLLLCYYDGCTRDEAARRLGWSLGTLRRRLDRGRDLLRVRLTGRGATLGASLLATVLATRGAKAAASRSLLDITTAAAESFAAGGALSGPVGQLTEEGLRMLGMSKVRAVVALVTLIGGVAIGTGALLGVGRDEPGTKKQSPVAHAPGAAETPLPDGVVLKHGGAPFRHGSDVISVLVTPDGKTILTQGYTTVRLWDAATGRGQGVLELPDDAAAFWTGSLTPDGRTLITTRHNGTAQVWDLAARKMTRSFRLAAPPFNVSGAKCVHSPDGKEIAVVTADGSVRVCDVAAGKEMDQLRSHSDEATAAAFAPDGKHLVVASGQGQLLEFDVARGSVDHAQRAEAVANLCFTPDGIRLAAAHGKVQGGARLDSMVSVFQPWTQATVELRGNSLAERLMVITPDNRYLLAPDRPSGGRIITQWDLITGRAIRQFAGDGGPIHAMTFTADGKTLITADTGLRFWDWKTGREQRSQPQPLWPWHSYALSLDGKAIAESDGAGGVRLWDTTGGVDLRRFEVPRPANSGAWISAVALSPDGRTVAAQGDFVPDGSTKMSDRRCYVWMWDAATGRLRFRLDDRPNSSEAEDNSRPWVGYQLLFSGDGRALVSTSPGRQPSAWNTETGGEAADLPILSNLRSPMVITPDASVVAGACNDNPIVVQFLARAPDDQREAFRGRCGRRLGWTAVTLALVEDGGHTYHVGAVAFSPDAARVAAAVLTDKSSSVFVFDDKKRVGTVRNLAREGTAIALTNDGKTVAVALMGESPPVVVFDVESGRELKRLTGVHGRATWLAFAPDGKRVYAASTDTTVQGWDTSDVVR